MKGFKFLGLCVLASALLVPAIGWASGTSETTPSPTAAATAGQALPRSETLYIGGYQWGPPTNFNPLAGNPAWPMGGNGTIAIQSNGYIYETLFVYNIVDGSHRPLLGKTMEWTSPTKLTVTLQPGTKWQDGQPLTAKDVVFTYELGKRFSLSFSPLWDYVSSVKALDDRTVEFSLSKVNQGIVEGFVFDTYILPEHVWAPIADKGQSAILQETNFSPVGSGAYKIMSYSPEQIVLQKYDTYWGASLYGTPKPKYFVHPIFKSNDDGNLALKQGTLDWSQQFVPNVWTMKNVGTWFDKKPYYLPGTIPILLINVHKPGLDNPLVRRALAYSINYAQIAITAMSEYSDPAQSSLIIPTGVESQYADANMVKQYGWSYDPKKAEDILQNQLNAKKGSDGIYVLPDGTKLSFTAQTPYGWTDWMAALQVVSQSAKQVGIEIATKFPQAPEVTSAVQSGNFDLAMRFNTPVAPDTPWHRFHDILDSRGVPAIGQTAFWDWGRYSNPDAAPLLDKAGAATTVAERKQALAALDKLFMQDVPAIPMMYRPLAFYEFNTSVWTGFPTSANPKGLQPTFNIYSVDQLSPAN